jgi:flagellar protein FliS
LHDALDHEQWAGSQGLADIYVFVLNELVTANVEKDAARIDACRSLLAPLRDAWREASGIVPSGSGPGGSAA